MGMHGSKRVRCIETGEVFASLTDASKKYGIHTSTLSIAINQLTKAKGLHWEYVERGKKHVQLCWYCANACGGCCWTERDPETGEVSYKPIPGWKAQKTIIKNSLNEETISFNILECPEFIRDRKD